MGGVSPGRQEVDGLRGWDLHRYETPSSRSSLHRQRGWRSGSWGLPGTVRRCGTVRPLPKGGRTLSQS